MIWCMFLFMFDSLRKAFSNVAQSLGEKELNEKEIMNSPILKFDE